MTDDVYYRQQYSENYEEKGVFYMEVNVEYLNKWASLTGERARLEANLFDSYIVYMDAMERVVKEFSDGRIEIIEEADSER